MKKTIVLGLVAILILSVSNFAFANDEILNKYAVRLERPIYPAELNVSGKLPKIELRITVNTKGKVIEATAISGDSSITNPSIKAALSSTFKIRRVSGKAVNYSGVLVYNSEVKY